MVCQGQDKVCRTTLDVCLDRPQTTSQIRKLAGLKVGTLGPASELLGDLEQSALSLDLRVPASKMEEVGPAPFRVLPVLRELLRGGGALSWPPWEGAWTREVGGGEGHSAPAIPSSW